MASSTAPEPVYPENYTTSTVVDKDRDNKEIQVPFEKERAEPVVTSTASDLEIQKGGKARRSWPWKWIFGILVVALCMLAIGIGIGYAIGNSKDGGGGGGGGNAGSSSYSSAPGFTAPPREDGRCGPQYGNATCDPTSEIGGCCSDKGWCGKNANHCAVCKGCQWGCTDTSKICS